MTDTPIPAAVRMDRLTEREDPFRLRAELFTLRDTGPIHPLLFSNDKPGWLITDRGLARDVLADERFSARSGHTRVPTEPAPIEPGMFIRMDEPDHARYRQLLTSEFTVRRMSQLTPRVEQIVHEHLDRMSAGDNPADLVQKFALPVPSMVICELLGVPYADRDRFQQVSAVLLDIDTDITAAETAYADVLDFLSELVTRTRRAPGDNLLSGLISTSALTHDELINIAFLLLSAGHETTANMLGLGAFALLQHPDQADLLRKKPGAVNGAVEELLRYTSIVQFLMSRMATEDIETAGVQIRTGEVVVISLPTANQDPDRFDDPERLDITRRAGGHLSFGHGAHLCLGQQLARIEMRIGFAALLNRFPDLALAVPPHEVPVRIDKTIYGVHSLPVTW